MTYNNTKNYVGMYQKNLLLGAQIGEAVFTVSSLSSPFPLQTQPLYNRVIDVGAYNLVQDQFYSPINVTPNNIIYLGMLQAAKYLPALLTQNYMKETFPIISEDNIGMKALKTFIVTSAGMTIFFTIGATESIITDLAYKTNFVYSITLGSLGYHAYSWMDSGLTKAGAVNLSPMSAVATTVGLIGSFLAPYALHELDIDKINPIKLLEGSAMISAVILSRGNVFIAAPSVVIIDMVFDSETVKNLELETIEVLGFNLVNMISLSAVTGAKLITSSYNDAIISISKIAAFSFVKANAVTCVEIVSDYKDDICLYPVIESACELLGITESVESPSL